MPNLLAPPGRRVAWLTSFASVLSLIIAGGAVRVQAADRNIRFERISSEQGLSQSSVLCMLQDRRGFMWFGTFDGLNRYDGSSFTGQMPNAPRLLIGVEPPTMDRISVRHNVT